MTSDPRPQPDYLKLPLEFSAIMRELRIVCWIIITYAAETNTSQPRPSDEPSNEAQLNMSLKKKGCLNPPNAF